MKLFGKKNTTTTNKKDDNQIDIMEMIVIFRTEQTKNYDADIDDDIDQQPISEQRIRRLTRRCRNRSDSKMVKNKNTDLKNDPWWMIYLQYEFIRTSKRITSIHHLNGTHNSSGV
ncbi:hypothetical protein DERP_014782 [Dermatophagoides pteronyssinus]|uniref:Uncharacterized protein n=1 Tax=Dermatophagoides pteronyssinus TaxID=6956 RepID=A0ABQ8J2I1_DERPT|nr:hypothetical protein DERP_014782 [Dermatophagoides pteronyssinus]